MSSSVLSNWVKKLSDKITNSGSRRARRLRSEVAKRQAWKNARPQVETLEDRITPTTFTVTDPSGVAGSGSAGDVTLPYAVANAASGDTINFNLPANTTITLDTTLTLSQDVTVAGPGPSLLAISGNNSVRVFVNNGNSSISGLTIENGNSSSGAGVLNSGTLTLSNDVIASNASHSGGPAGYGSGGGMFNYGTLSMSQCTVSGNSANYGGGLENWNGGTASIDSCTFTNNSAGGSGSGVNDWLGGAIAISNSTFAYNGNGSGAVWDSGNTISLISCTVAFNSSSGVDVTSMDNCIVGGNTGSDVVSGSGSFNLVGDVSGLSTSLDYNNSAPTQTLALPPGSDAIGVGDPAQAGTTAQNGILRPAAPDIGAYQTQSLPIGPQTINPASTVYPDITTSLTITGTGFDTNAANDAVLFNQGLAGTVVSATSTSLVVDITTPPTSLGQLTANAIVDGIMMATSVPIGTEVNATWNVTSTAGSGGSLTNITLPYATHALDGDTITFAASTDTVPIVLSSSLTLNLGHGVDIIGNGPANTIISGNNLVRVFFNHATATISGVTVENGSGVTGGGIFNSGTLTLSNDVISGNAASYSGGGIANADGTLTMSEDTVSGNTATYGGGLANRVGGNATVDNCTFNNNSVLFSGSGVSNWSGDSISVSNTTIAYNTGSFPTSSGIWNDFGGPMTLTADTIAYNTGYGVYDLGIDTIGSMDSTIVAGNSVGDLFDSVTGTSNVIGNTTGLSTTLAYNNSAPTQTLAIGYNSPAFLAGDSALAGTISQNGLTRTAIPDAGAYQTESLPIGTQTITVNTANIPDTATSITIIGTGFDPNPANDIVAFNLGVTGTVVSATATTLVVNITSPPDSLGQLNAVAVVDLTITPAPVQVGTEVNSTWNVTSTAGSGGSLTSITLPYAAAHALDGDTITFATSTNGTPIVVAKTLTLDHNVDIVGNGSQNTLVSGGGLVQVLHNNANATVSGLTIEAGNASTGGGIFNAGSLTLSGDMISGNTAFWSGGGIFNSGTLMVSDSTISSNYVQWDGGGLLNIGTATLINSTVAENTAYTYGGGLMNGLGTMALTDCTVVYNHGDHNSPNLPIYGGGIENYSYTSNGGPPISGTLTLSNTIVSGNNTSDVDGPYTDLGFNLIGGVTGLTALGNYGGGIETVALLPGSTAIGVGDPAQAGTVSQNGLTRPAAPDVGAYQSPPVSLSIVVASNTADLPDSATTLTIFGSGFDSNPANDFVLFNLGLAGTVTAASSTYLTVTITSPPTALGALDVGVIVDGFGMGSAVQVATEVNSDWVVTNTDGHAADGSLSNMTLPYAAAHTLSGDEITFAASTNGVPIVLDGALTLNNDVNIVGNGPANSIISGNNLVTPFVNYASLSISGVTIENGDAFSGGGIANLGTLTLSNDALTDNFAIEGGAVFNEGTLTISDSTFTSDSGVYGGAVLSFGTMTITDSTFTSNFGYQGGAIDNYGLATISDSTISGNSAFWSGGGIANVEGSLTASNDIISNNSASLGGGVFNFLYGTVAVSDSTISDNTATNAGGGAFNLAGGTMTLTDSTISGNSAGLGGGVSNGWGSYRFAYLPDTMVIQDCTITGNTAQSGGGVFNTSGLTVSDSTISDNTATGGNAFLGYGSGGGIFNQGTLQMSESTVSGNTGVYGGGFENGTSNNVYYFGPATMSLTDCTISDNTTGGSGSGINNWTGTSITLTDCTVAYNTGPSGSGAIYSDTGGAVNLTSCTVAFNTGDGVDSFGTPMSMDNCLVGGNSGADVTGTVTGSYNLIGDTTGLSATLAFNNGAATETLALTPPSDAISLGDPSLAGTLSQNGLTLPSTPDIGAYQSPPTVTQSTAYLPVTSTTVTIHGYDFDTNPTFDSVSFTNAGVTGVVTAATSTSLTVTLTGFNSQTGGAALDATVTVRGTNVSAAPVQVATAQEVITPSTASVPNTATSIVIHGLGFDTNILHDSVTFDDGVTGVVTAATATSLTVSVNLSGIVVNNTPLHAEVFVNGVPDTALGTAQVATVTVTSTDTAPTITDVVLNQDISALNSGITGATQRSMVEDIVYTFSEPVNIVSNTVDPNLFHITAFTVDGVTGVVPATIEWAPVAGSGGLQWEVDFGVNPDASAGQLNSIANGCYSITITNFSEITEVGGGHLAANINAGPAPGVASSVLAGYNPANANYATQSFFRLFGDGNGDGIVNPGDNNKFKPAITTYNAAFDFNQDGIVNPGDNNRFKADLGLDFTAFTATI